MKSKLSLLLLLPFSSFGQSVYHNCPLSGDKPKTAHLDSLKNRYEILGQYIPVSFDEMANMPYTDTSTYPVSIEGYIILVKPGGKETCNCHSATDVDIHIELAKTPDATGDDAIICEINPRLQDKLEYSLKSVKSSYLHKKVRIYGYLFSDSEHKQNSKADNPHGTFIWRATCKEVHPVTKIELLANH